MAAPIQDNRSIATDFSGAVCLKLKKEWLYPYDPLRTGLVPACSSPSLHKWVLRYEQ